MNEPVIKTIANAIEDFSFKGKSALLHYLSPRTGIKNSRVFGYDIELDLCDYIQRSVYLNTFEPQESTWIKDYLQPGMTFVDVGANIGYYSLMAASLVGDRGRVFAFEPSPYVHGKLQATIDRNQIANIQAIQAGLSDTEGNLQLFIQTQPGNHTPSMVETPGCRSIEVPVYQLDKYLSTNQIDRVDLLKIDVEGFEPNAIEGGMDYIRNGKIGAILVELNDYWLNANGCSSHSLYMKITELGFQANTGFDPNKSLQNMFFRLIK
jgi:FkbM family methyltransferase